MAQQTPWAILRCKWADSNDEPESDQFFQQLFTPAGAGTRNMVEYFDLMSHGNVDVSGSQVFGWFTLPQPQTDYVADSVPNPAPGQITRMGLVELAKSTAIQHGVDLTPFFGVCVCMNTVTDLFGAFGLAVCGPTSYMPSVLAHEMGHGYGLDHSGVDGSTGRYLDPWDTMSTWNSCHIAADPNYTEIGPGLNAANMHGRGWLDQSRVWRSPDPFYGLTLELRPLHRRDLPGWLGARAHHLFVEFRHKSGWDAAIPRSCVLVHNFHQNRSFILPALSGAYDLVADDVFKTDPGGSPFAAFFRVEVHEIDEANLTARVTVERRFGTGGVGTFPGVPIGAVEEDGGGFIVLGDQKVPVPPSDPLYEVLEHLVAYKAVDNVRDTVARDAVRRAAAEELAAFARAEIDRIEHIESPPKRVEPAPKPVPRQHEH